MVPADLCEFAEPRKPSWWDRFNCWFFGHRRRKVCNWCRAMKRPRCPNFLCAVCGRIIAEE